MRRETNERRKLQEELKSATPKNPVNFSIVTLHQRSGTKERRPYLKLRRAQESGASRSPTFVQMNCLMMARKMNRIACFTVSIIRISDAHGPPHQKLIKFNHVQFVPRLFPLVNF